MMVTQRCGNRRVSTYKALSLPTTTSLASVAAGSCFLFPLAIEARHCSMTGAYSARKDHTTNIEMIFVLIFEDWRAGDWRVDQRSRLMQFPVCLSCVHPVTLNANCCFVMFLIFTTSVLYFLMYFYVKIWIIGCWPASSEIDGEALALVLGRTDVAFCCT